MGFRILCFRVGSLGIFGVGWSEVWLFCFCVSLVKVCVELVEVVMVVGGGGVKGIEGVYKRCFI